MIHTNSCNPPTVYCAGYTMTADRRNSPTFLHKLASVCSQNLLRHRSIDDVGAASLKCETFAMLPVSCCSQLASVSSRPIDGRSSTMNRMSRNSLRTNILESCSVSLIDAGRTVNVGLSSVASVVVTNGG